MENEIVKYTPVELVQKVWSLPRTTKTKDRIGMMLQVPEVVQALTATEKAIAICSTKTAIADLPKADLAKAVKLLFDNISKDLGIRTQNDADWTYKQTRMFELICKYFPDFTLGDFKFAFELLLVDELDNYLPRDSRGEADKKHYQNFNPEFLLKILKAYKQKRNEIFVKVHTAMPKPIAVISDEMRRKNEDSIKVRCIYSYLRYKYLGELIFDVRLYSVWEWLTSIGQDVEYKITNKDRQQGLNEYRARIAKGYINSFDGAKVIKKGIYAPEIANEVQNVALMNAIKMAFDEMLADEVQVKEATTFKYFKIR